ncbi:hypothetical protein [uncultured Xanthomonas sp.]|uniref:hypothetical protein n=1 Tax=uncultured Xanthomonas sp. TaxID=152831 RepID=UPI0025DCF809|nr:hypothetical protein [uncultured Xanthomonas sp.]
MEVTEDTQEQPTPLVVHSGYETDDERTRPDYLPPARREGSGIWWTLIVGACLAGALAGGAALYIETVKDWHSARQPRAQITANAGTEQNSADIERQEYKRRKLAEIQAKRTEIAEMENWMSKGEIRCINGTLFRRINGGWENLPGKECHKP